MMRRLRRGLLVTAGMVLLGLGLGYLGRLHPAGDSLAVFRAQGVAALLVIAVASRRAGAGRLAGAVGLVAVLAGAPLVAAYAWPGDAGGLVLYQKNVLYRNDDLGALEADIRAVAPDVVTLQEMSQPNLALLERLADLVPHQIYCPYETVGGVAVATRLEPVVGAEVCVPGLAAMQVEGAAGRVWLVSIHQHWPWPYRQPGHQALLLPVIAGLEGAVVIAGDFNMVRWSGAMGRVREAGRVEHAGPVQGSFPRFGPLAVLAIDHVLAPGGGSLERRGLMGSDHYGLVGRLRL